MASPVPMADRPVRPPFTIDLSGAASTSEAQEHAKLDAECPYPASFRVQDDLYVLSQNGGNVRFIEADLDLTRVHRIVRYLWLTGRPAPPRPLHYQLLLERSIVITEKMDMHLMWSPGRIFLKPIPRYLLRPGFWTHGFAGKDGLGHLPGDIWASALGFLTSYAALIQRESDFRIALQHQLLPDYIGWHQWCRFVEELLDCDGHDSRLPASSHIAAVNSNREPSQVFTKVAIRFVYGELRLDRLNLIYLCLGYSTSYQPRWNTYRGFLHDNSTLILASFGYAFIFLTAMQVGLAANDDDRFRAASWGFSVFTIIAPLVAVVVILLLYLVGLVWNWQWAARREKARAEELQREWRTAIAPKALINSTIDAV